MGRKDIGAVDYPALGYRISRLRYNNTKLTQEAVSEKLGISTAYYSRLESGKRMFSLETLVQLASIFNVSLDYLLQDSLEKQYTTDGNEELLSTFSSLDAEKRTRMLGMLRVLVRNYEEIF